jgi:hypothetical protein
VLGPIQAANANLQMYSVGLGSNIEATKLQSITNMGTEGYHQVSDSLTGESVYDLENFYFKIFSNATGMDLVVDPTHVVNLLNPNPIIIDSATIISSDRSDPVLDDPVLRAFYTRVRARPVRSSFRESRSVESRSRKRAGTPTRSTASCFRTSRKPTLTLVIGCYA